MSKTRASWDSSRTDVDAGTTEAVDALGLEERDFLSVRRRAALRAIVVSSGAAQGHTALTADATPPLPPPMTTQSYEPDDALFTGAIDARARAI